MNLLSDPIITLDGGGKVSLPAVFAMLAQGEVRGFSALRPFQRPAWHMFLVQLGALAMWGNGTTEPPTDAPEWATLLRALTPDHDDDAPWQLVVPNTSRPAFLQPPVPAGLKWSLVPTPDALDMLITARNHDVKKAVATDAAPEDWVFALVSLQTMEGYGGSGKYGIARMNGGSSSRTILALVPTTSDTNNTIDPSAWWRRDVLVLLKHRLAGNDEVGRNRRIGLLWCECWSDGPPLAMDELDPWAIEVCRRVRLCEAEGTISATAASSKTARIEARALNGNVGDPWAPIHRADDKSLTLSDQDFDYRKLYELLYDDWYRPLLSRQAVDESGDMLLVAEAFARGNSKTYGFKSRVVPIPRAVSGLFDSPTAGALAKDQMNEVEGFDKALRFAVALTAANGDRDAVKKEHYALAKTAVKRFNHEADRHFFRSLWKRVQSESENDREQAKLDFLKRMLEAATDVLKVELPSLPCAAAYRLRAEVRGHRALRSRLRQHEACRALFDEAEESDATAA